MRTVLEAVQEHYDAGRFAQAWQAGLELGPPEQWPGTVARVLGGRLLNHCGHRERGRRLILRTWRRDPGHPEARHHFLWHLLELRGPWVAWQRFLDWSLPDDAPARDRADHLVLGAYLAGSLREFGEADALLAQAESLAPTLPWLNVVRAHCREQEDRHAEALDAARRGLELHPHYWAAAGAAAGALVALGRDREAVALLEAEAPHSECAHLHSELAGLLTELDDPAGARRALARIPQCQPALKGVCEQWWHARSADAAYLDGDFPAARDHAAALVGDPFFEAFARRMLEARPEDRRVQLPVGYVRQHHVTCAPATLTALSRYWGRPAEHLEVAEAICYDGTPSHAERRWATDQGWIAREFKVDAAIARTLVDRGVPFVLTTVNPGNAHAQAVMGYDDRRGTLLIRDPYFRSRNEFICATGFLDQAASGPRGMILLPPEEAARLEGVELPDAAVYDDHHALLLALDQHDRSAAGAALERLERGHPGHRLTWQARWALAAYDGDLRRVVAALTALHELFPDDVNLQLARLGALRDLARRDERLALLRAACGRKDADPLLWLELAADLAADAREHPEARRWLRRAARRRLFDPGLLLQLGELEWASGTPAAAVRLSRAAAAADDKKEHPASVYFSASRWVGETERAVAWLTARFERHGRRSSLPARTLFHALWSIDDTTRALAVLDRALEWRPDDGELRIFAAERFTIAGDLTRAEGLLAGARGRAHPNAWLHASATLAARRGDFAAELEFCRELVAREPRLVETHRRIAVLLAQSEGRAAALAHLTAALERLPLFVPLHQARIEWLHDDGPAAVETAARALLAVNDIDVWAHRELALVLSRQHRPAEALREIDLAMELEPRGSQTWSVRGRLLVAAGRRADARAAFRRAVELSVDNDEALRGWLEAAERVGDREEALRLIHEELVRQTTFGTGLLAYPDLARPFLPAEELLARLRTAHQARRDLWQAWAVLGRQLAAMGRFDEARECLREATARFPHLPVVWSELAAVEHGRLDNDGRIAALRRACELNPDWSWAARELSGALHAAGEAAAAREQLEHAIRRVPLDPMNHGCLADLKWRGDDLAGAAEAAREAVRVEPHYDWAWNALAHLGPRIGQPDLARQLAREWTARQPGEAAAWIMLGRQLDEPEQREERLDAFARARAVHPTHLGAAVWQVIALTEAGRFDDALEACAIPALGEPPLAALQARRAWVYAQRGALHVAIDRMRAALVEDPGMSWGWDQLVNWLADTGQLAEASVAVERLLHLVPNDPEVLERAALIKWRNDQRPAAVQDLARAFALAPTLASVGAALFNAQLATGDPTGATATLERLQPLLRPTRWHAAATRLALATGQTPVAWHHLVELCRNTEDDPEAFGSVAAALRDHPDLRPAAEVVKRQLRNPVLNPATGAFWLQLVEASGRTPGRRVLRRLPPRSEVAARAWAHVLSRFGAKYSGPSLMRGYHRLRFRLWLHTHRDWCRSHDLLWGQVGYVLAVMRQSRELIAWMADWESRREVQPWMLTNLVLAHQRLGEAGRGDAIAEAGLRLTGSQGPEPRFRLLLAWRDALADDRAGAQLHLDAVQHQTLDAYEQSLLAAARSLLLFLDPTAPPRAFDDREAAVWRQLLEDAGDNPVMRERGRAALRRIAERTGSQAPLKLS